MTGNRAAIQILGPAARSPRRRRGLTTSWGVAPLLAYIAALLVIPAVLLVVYSFFTAGFFTVEFTLTTTNYLNVVTEPLYWQLLLKSVALGLSIAVVMTVLAFAMAYAMTFRLGKWGPRILVLVVATLLSSYVVRIYAWATILGTNGIFNTTLQKLGLIDQPIQFLLYGTFAIVLTLIYVYLPLVVLPIYAGMQDIDPRLVEASRDLGAPPLETFWKIIWPLSWPAVRVAFIFAFILATSDYITPSLVGGVQGQMIGSVISDQFGGASNYPQGAALAVSLVLSFGVVLGLLVGAGRLVQRFKRTRGRPRRRAGRQGPRTTLLHRVPSLGFPFAFLITMLLLLFLAVPLITVLVFSFNGTTNPGLPLENPSLHWYSTVLASEQFHRALGTSLTVALGAVTIALVLGIPAALALARGGLRGGGIIQTAAYGSLAVPGIVLGVALLTTFVYLDVTLGVWTTMAAHALLVIPYVVLVMRNRLKTINADVLAAARDLGSRPRRVFGTITLPLVMPSLVGVAILGVAISFDELVVTNFTIGNNATVPVWVLSQMRTGLTPAINAIAVLMLAAGVLLLCLTSLSLRLWRSSRSSLTRTIVEVG